jgi:hypothetical protein
MRQRTLGGLVGLLGVLVHASAGTAQEAIVVGVQTDGAVVDITRTPDLLTGAKVGFVRITDGRREIGQGSVLRVSQGTALVGLPATGSVQQGDLVIRCPDAASIEAGRVATTQLNQQAAHLGATIPEIRLKMGLLQSVIEAKEGGVRRGACDLSQYDAQISMLATDLQQTVARGQPLTMPTAVQPLAPAGASGFGPAASSSAVVPPTAFPQPTITGDPAQPTAFPQPGTASPTAGGASPVGAVAPAASPAQGGQGSTLEALEKMGQMFQSLLGKLGSQGGSQGNSGSNFGSGQGNSGNVDFGSGQGNGGGSNFGSGQGNSSNGNFGSGQGNSGNGNFGLGQGNSGNGNFGSGQGNNGNSNSGTGQGNSGAAGVVPISPSPAPGGTGALVPLPPVPPAVTMPTPGSSPGGLRPAPPKLVLPPGTLPSLTPPPSAAVVPSRPAIQPTTSGLEGQVTSGQARTLLPSPVPVGTPGRRQIPRTPPRVQNP